MIKSNYLGNGAKEGQMEREDEKWKQIDMDAYKSQINHHSEREVPTFYSEKPSLGVYQSTGSHSNHHHKSSISHARSYSNI